jgi:uncharacterized membrane protein
MKTSTKVIEWIARILCILFMLGLVFMSFDSVLHQHAFWGKVGTFLANSAPALVLLVILIIAWKNEKAGGISVLIFSLAFLIYAFLIIYIRSGSVVEGLKGPLMFCLPLIVAGILFIISHNRRKKELSANQ